MKIKTKRKTAEEVMSLPPITHKKPKKQRAFFRWLVNSISKKELEETHFSFDPKGFDDLGDVPCLVLMNHSCFLDLKMAFRMMSKRPFNIVCTSDGFVGKAGLMYSLGCIPTEKFVPDYSLVRDIKYALNKLGQSVLMYPEASYSFDGTATPLPESVGALIKLLGVPVVTVITHGAFLHDPLYNGLRLRKVDVSAVTELTFTGDMITNMTVDEINGRLREIFTFNAFLEQKDKGVLITEEFRAEGLERVLYKCPVCGAEGCMKGKGTHIICENCGADRILTENGEICATDGGKTFPSIPEWYAWERNEVRKQISDGTYSLDIEVDIGVMTDMKAIYETGRGRLIHDKNGFMLKSNDGVIDHRQSPVFSYSVYSDYFWYEISDMVCIGDKNKLFYCFPTDKTVPVAKIRLAAEELYKINKKK